MRALLWIAVGVTVLVRPLESPARAAPGFRVVAFYTAKLDPAHISFVNEARPWFSQLAAKYQFSFDTTSDWRNLNPEFLARTDVVVFLDTRPEDPTQRAAFRAYMENGGAWMGFHFAGFALTPSAYPANWSWYHDTLIGAGSYASNTWRPTAAVLRVQDRAHPVTAQLPPTFRSAPSEWYRWERDLRRNPAIDILLAIDSTSFPLGTGPKPDEIWHSGYYPVVWTNKKYRMVYFNMGHNDIDYEHKYDTTNRTLSSTFSSATQNQLITDALLWLGRGKGQPPTAQEVVQRIQQNIGVPWTEPTVDTFKDGDPATPVTGVAVTMMATLDVLQRAAARGANLVITHEPTFYDHFDKLDVLEGDSVTLAKRAFIREHRMVVVRMHDHWHRRRPEPMATDLARVLGWERYRGASEWLYRLPETRLAELAATIRRRLPAPTLRVVGDSALRVTKIGLSPGAAGFARHRQLLQQDDVEVLIIGEAHEWETVEYVADAATAGRRKALIILGHVPSEQDGMEEFARWLGGLVKEVPVTFVPAADPFWAPR